MPDAMNIPHVEIYTSPFCGFCMRAKALLDQKGVVYDEYDVMMDISLKTTMMERSNGDHRVPQIFINNEHIGGCDNLLMLEMAGQLDEKLTAVG